MPVATRENLVAECSAAELDELLNAAVEPNMDAEEAEVARMRRLAQALQAGDERLSEYLPQGLDTPERAQLRGSAIRFCIEEALFWLRRTNRGRTLTEQDMELAEQRARDMGHAFKRGAVVKQGASQRYESPCIVHSNHPGSLARLRKYG